MPQPSPEEFRDDVIRVAMNRGPSVSIARVVKELGVHVGTLDKWRCVGRIDSGEQTRESRSGPVELRELRERNRLLK